jgi:hypothetical protein
MRKQLIVACLALAAFAVVPSLASAKPVLTHPTNTVAPVGTSITATNVGNSVLTNGLGTITCTTAILTGSLTSNSTANGIQGTITKADFGGTTGKTIPGDTEPECTGTGFYAGGAGITTNPPYCLQATGTTDTIAVRGGGCGGVLGKPKFRLSVTTIFGTVTCEYASTAAEGLTGSLVTDTSGQEAQGTLTEQGFSLSGGGGECPSEGKLTLTVRLETDLGPSFTPLFVSS